MQSLLLATTVSESSAEFPFSLHIGLAVIIIVGVAVWILGQRLIRPMLILTGAGVGAGLGMLGGAFLPHSVSLWWPMILGACVLALVAFGMYRMFMAGTFAVTLALVAPLGFFAWAEITHQYDEETSPEVTAEELELPLPVRDELQRRIDQLDEIADEASKPPEDRDEEIAASPDGERRRFLPEMDEETQERVEATVQHWRDRLRRTIESIGHVAATHWKDFPTRQKAATIVSSVAGAAIGLVAGVIGPNIAAMLTTSLVGAALFLMSGLGLLRSVGMSNEMIEPGSAAGALVMWLSVGLIGTVFQYRTSRGTPENTRGAEE